MDWGSAPAWAALVVATAAFIVSFKAMRNGARSAKAAENSAAASLRSAAASEATLADRRAEADRENRERDEAAKPRPDVHIEYVSGDTWALRNTGTTVADGDRARLAASNDSSRELEPGGRGSEDVPHGGGHVYTGTASALAHVGGPG